MKANFREIIGTAKLTAMLGIESTKDLNLKQKKAVHNIKYCANDMWQFVNSWYDEKSEDARQLMMNPKKIFQIVYTDSLTNIYDDGSCSFGKGAEMWLKDIRFCGKAFLEKVVLYYTAKLLEESVPEVDGTDEDAERVGRELLQLQAELKAQW